MNEMPRFCTNCGTPLRSGTRFCGQCGAPVLSTPAAPAYQAPAGPVVAAPYPPPVAEPVLAMVLGLQRRKGLMGVDTMNLVATPARLIFAMVTKQMMKEAVVTARDEAKSQGKGFFGQVAAQMAWVNVVCREYYTMPIDAILARYPGSFFIPSAGVRRIRLKHSTLNDQGNRSDQELIIEATNGKHRFALLGMDVREARRTLQQALGSVVK